MIILLVTLITMILVAWILMHYGSKMAINRGAYAETFGVIMCIFSGIGVIGYGLLFVTWISAGYEVEIINHKYCTNYTQEQVLWAKHTINQVIKNQCDR